MNTLKVVVVVGIALGGAVGCSTETGVELRITWENKILRIDGDEIPGGPVEVWYLEAFCRTGSTNRNWRETTIPFSMEKLEADPDGGPWCPYRPLPLRDGSNWNARRRRAVAALHQGSRRSGRT